MLMIGMTGKDLIIYILNNDLLDKPVYENDKLLGFMNIEEAAVKFEVGVATVMVWIERGKLNAVRIGDELFIPFDAENPLKGVSDV